MCYTVFLKYIDDKVVSEIFQCPRTSVEKNREQSFEFL